MKTLRRGDSGREVANLKGYLAGSGMRQTKSDRFDLVCEASVRALQAHENLEQDGIVGPKTWKDVLQPDRIYADTIDVLKWIQPRTPYYPQRDNQYNPAGTCNVTSLAMVLAFHGQKPWKTDQLEDDLFWLLQRPESIRYFNKNFPALKKMGYKPRHVHGMLGYLAKLLGYSWNLSEATSWNAMSAFGTSTGPLITSGSFTRAGHIIVVVGMTINNDLVVHDPWGDWNSGYRDQNGKFRIYSHADMQKVLSGRSSDLKRTHRISK